KYSFAHKATSVEEFRCSWDFGMSWRDWSNWEDTSLLDASSFSSSENFGDRDRIMTSSLANFFFLYWSAAPVSTSHIVHADYGYSGKNRHIPQFLTHGPFNQWGFNQGL
ncbi:hypothetical protein DL96DRAFT_1429342, partial [Flagelloscypha sp. PMI_526]